VLCEKPLALDDSQADEIVAGCRRHGVVLMEAFMWRHHPRVGRALDMLRGGQIGELRLIKVDFSFPIDRSDWRLDPARGGGALFDIGCYGINAARLFTGSEPVEISAHAQMAESGVDMTIGMLLRFAGGELGLVDASFEAPDRNRLELVGTRASIEFPGGFLPSAETTLVIRRDRELEIMPFAGADQYAAQFEAFGESVRTGRLCYPAEDGLANMKALDQVRRIAWRHC
jgi:predicted dehydrogenase